VHGARILGCVERLATRKGRGVEAAVRTMLERFASLGQEAWAGWLAMTGGALWRPDLTPWVVALVALLMLALLRRRPRPLEVRPPQLLITHGEVHLELAEGSASPARSRAGLPAAAEAGTVSLTLSNLSRYPIQVLEVALRPLGRGAPRIGVVEAVVPPLAVVDLQVRVPLALEGDGWLEVYCYAAAPRQKLHRHRAELVWEPWVTRFKVAPMDQVTDPVRRVASSDRRALLLPESVADQPVDPPLAALEAEPEGLSAHEPVAELPAREELLGEAEERPVGEGEPVVAAELPLSAVWARLAKRPRQELPPPLNAALPVEAPSLPEHPESPPPSAPSPSAAPLGAHGRSSEAPEEGSEEVPTEPRQRLEFPEKF